MADENGNGSQGEQQQQQGGGFNLEAALTSLISKHGSADNALAKLVEDNFKARERARKAEEERDELKRRVPAEGAVVVSKEDAADLEAFRALGKKPDELKVLGEEHLALKRDARLTSVAAAGWNADALRDFDTLEGGLEYEVTEEGEGKDKRKVAYVVADGKRRPFEEYARDKRPALLAALKATGGEQQRGMRHFQQSTTGAQPKSVVEEFEARKRARDAARPDPFARPAAAATAT